MHFNANSSYLLYIFLCALFTRWFFYWRNPFWILSQSTFHFPNGLNGALWSPTLYVPLSCLPWALLYYFILFYHTLSSINNQWFLISFSGYLFYCGFRCIRACFLSMLRFFFLLIVLLLQGFIDNSIKAVKAGSGYLLAPKNVITFIDFISAFFYCCQVTPLICTLIEVVALACSFTFLKAQNVRHGSSASTGRRITTRRPRAPTAHPYQRRHPF